MNRHIVVTGASSGIGRAIALAFAAAGDRLVITGYRNPSGLHETASEAHRISAAATAAKVDDTRCSSYRLDLSDVSQLQNLFEHAVEFLQGRLDVWINAAGADVLTGSGGDLTFDEKLDLLWRVDVRGTILLSRMASEQMAVQEPAGGEQAAKPLILNISWDQADRGIAAESGQYFGATKAAIAAFSKSLAISVGPKVRVNCLAPGWIRTAWGERDASQAWQDRAVGESSMGRWGTPEDVAAAALWLADPTAEFINGQTIDINGGWKPAYD